MHMEAERAMELMGRAIRMAGYQNIKSANQTIKNHRSVIEVQKMTGFQQSDALTVRHQISDGVDFDCIGNVLTKDRTKYQLALQGFLVDRQAGLIKSTRTAAGSLICQSLDRHGRIQNSTLMNGVSFLSIDELPGLGSGQRAFRIKLKMTDGALIHKEFERTFTTRNLP